MKSASPRRHRIAWCILSVTLLVIAAAVSLSVPQRAVRRVQNRVVPLPPPPPLEFRAAREVYPYSVVPGGVYDPAELRQSIEQDPVVREHYRGIQVDGLAPTRLREPVLAYVSYRKGNVVSWTRKKLVIPKDELVLTDGTNFVRARCGNLVRELPPPVAKSRIEEEPPPDIVFDSPVPSVTLLPPRLRPVLRPVEIFYWEERARIVRKRYPPNPVPEPGTIALVVSGLAGLGAAAWRRKRRTF